MATESAFMLGGAYAVTSGAGSLMMQWSIIAAVNNECVLQSCLLNSPGIESAAEVILQRGYRSAPSAYNAAIQQATTDLLAFVHQDVYLPEGWMDSVNRAVEILTRRDPNWGVVGVWGAVASKVGIGHLYWTGLPCLGGKPFAGEIEVTSLDEVVLILRKPSGLRFDERLPGYHLYGTDICLEAKRQEMKCYALSLFCIHNTNMGYLLPVQFWRCYLFMRKKWKNELPITTPCTTITYWCWPILRWNVVRVVNLLLRRATVVRRIADPAELYRDFIRRRWIRTTAE